MAGNVGVSGFGESLRARVDGAVREGMARKVPGPMEARRISDLHVRLLQRVRGLELALQDFEADLRRMKDLYGEVGKED